MAELHFAIDFGGPASAPACCTLQVLAIGNSSSACATSACATLCFLHCSGRICCKRCPAGGAEAVLLQARDLVARQVGGARHYLLCTSTGRPLPPDGAVTAGEMLLVVLEGANFHLSPLCEGNIGAQFPLPDYASLWLDVPTTPVPLSRYVDQALADGSAPPMPDAVFALAFRLRHGGRSDAEPPCNPAGPLSARGNSSEGPPVPEGTSTEELPGRLGAPGSFVEQVSGSRAAVAPSATASGKVRVRNSRGDRVCPCGDDPSAEAGVCGFTVAECMVLMERGIQPWQEEAAEVLAALKRAKQELSISHARPRLPAQR